MIKLLLEQPNTINKFLALVAMLCLAETMGLEDEHALILGCVGTAGSLKLHMGFVVRNSCYNTEQAGQVEKAMLMLYCIDKSYALRWKSIPILELRKVVQEATSDYLLEKITELATALDNWRKSITENAVISSLEEEATRRVEHQAFCQYHEALLHLEYEMVRQRSVRDVIISCNTISLNDLLQDQ
ncbi:hypothetical protein CFE70_002758 [Pyrenophora teres f. teres 0-1]